MKLSIRQKFSSIVIGSILLTGLAITVAYYFIATNQKSQENSHKIKVASRGIEQRLTTAIDELDKKYAQFELDSKLNDDLYAIVQRKPLDFQMSPKILLINELIDIDEYAFYEKENTISNLLLYFSNKLGGTVFINQGQHKLYEHDNISSIAINNLAIFPTQMPKEREDEIVVKNGELTLQSWKDYFHFSRPNSIQNKIKVGSFLLQKKLNLDVNRVSLEMGVDLSFFNRSGHTVFTQSGAKDLSPSLLNNFEQTHETNHDSSLSDSLLVPIVVNDYKVGFVLISISNKDTNTKFINDFQLVSLVSAAIVLLLLSLGRQIVYRLVKPIAQLREVSKAIAQGDMNKSLVIKGNDEFALLANNLNSMRDAIRQQMDKLKEEITDRKVAQENVQILSQAVEQSPVAVVITDGNGIIQYANSSFERISGYGLAESVGRRPEELGSGINLGRRRAELQQTLLAGEIWEEEFESQKKNGEIYWERVHVAPFNDASGKTTHYLSVREDVTLRKKQEEHIYHQAHFDSLTELPNRFLALDRLHQQIDDTERNGKMVAVIFMDLDGFKKINDSLGHEVGDRLLIKAASRLKSVVRKPDTVARLGGDEFLILLSGLSAISNVSRIAEKILGSMKKVFTIDKRQLNLTASAGIAIYPSDGENVTELLKNADSAMYHSKDLGRDTFSFFTKEMNENIARELAIEEQLHGAIGRKELSVLYQPKIDIASGKVVGAEALVRWNNNFLGIVSPVEFIGVAEQAGLIIQIGDYVMQQALEMTARWRANDLADFRIAVNLSPRQFHEPRMVEKIENKLRKLDLPFDALELEITEGVLLSGHVVVKDSLKKLSELGLCIAMDDFGTGYSSLSYLREYPFDVLKIDRSFIKDVITSASDQELVNATIAMAHGLGLKVVAEGIETSQQLEYLAEVNCDIAQGYLLGKPMSEAELFSLAKRQHLSIVS